MARSRRYSSFAADQRRDVTLRHGVKGKVGVDLLLPDHPDDFVHQHPVFEHQQVRFKNVRLLRAQGFQHLALDFQDLLAGLDEGLFKTADFLVEFVVGQSAPGDDVAGAVEDKNFPAANAGGNGNAAKHLFSFCLLRHTCRHRNNQTRSP